MADVLDRPYEFLRRVEEHLADLVVKTEAELVSAMLQEWVYQREYAHPKHIGKPQALDGIATYQKRIRHLREQLQVYEDYAEQHNLAILLVRERDDG